MITRKEVLMDRDKEYPLSKEFEANLAILLERLNKFRNIYGKPLFVSSGYRPGKYNKGAGGANSSAHLTCQATDFKDVDGALKKYIKDNPTILETCDLYLEAPESTPSWIHLQSRKTKSGKRIFKP